MSTGEVLDAALRQLRVDCPDLVGALITTEEGLLLACSGALQGETAAAMASHMADALDQILTMLADTACNEALLWTSTGLWGVARLATRHVVMVQGVAECRAANLRLALGRLRKDLAVPLRDLAC